MYVGMGRQAGQPDRQNLPRLRVQVLHVRLGCLILLVGQQLIQGVEVDRGHVVWGTGFPQGDEGHPWTRGTVLTDLVGQRVTGHELHVKFCW